MSTKNQLPYTNRNLLFRQISKISSEARFRKLHYHGY